MTDWKRCQKAADDRFWGRLWWVPKHEAEAKLAALEAARDKALDTAEEFRAERDEAKAELRRLRARVESEDYIKEAMR